MGYKTLVIRQYNNRSETSIKIWENYEYITEICNRTNRPENLEVEPEEEVDADEKGRYILKSEVEKAIKGMRDNNATGDDDIPGDVLRLFGNDGIKIMTQLINIMQENGEWPKDFTEGCNWDAENNIRMNFGHR